MSDHTDTLTDTERDSLTECECGHYLNEHSSDGCLATVYDGDDGMASLDDVCACMATPDLIRERAIVAIVADRVAAARADERTRLVARLRDIVATPDDEQWWPVEPYTDPVDDDEVVEVQVINSDRLRALIEGADQ